MAAGRKAEFNRRCRELERAAISVLDPGTDTLAHRERRAKQKAEHVNDLSEAYLLALAKADKRLGQAVRNLLLPVLAKWELSLDDDVYYPGDLRSKPR